MAVLLGLEVVSTVIWLSGVNIAGAVDGAAPWTRMSAERGDRMCLPVAVVNFWL